MNSVSADGIISLAIGILFACIFLGIVIHRPILWAFVLILIYAALCAPILIYSYNTVRSAREIYNNILQRTEKMDMAEYAQVCKEAEEAGEIFGGFYFGEDHLYSPFGMIVAWDRIRAVKAEFVYAVKKWETRPYSRITVSVTLSDGGEVSAVIRGSRAVTAFSSGIDEFCNLVCAKCGDIPLDKVYL